ncbi:MAG: GNAT family N-acetyltransferase [Bacteroidales bacterium]|nr:GNAT family N-acetyltransferase [Bacteroidales bacterium]MCF8386780.1 GNAT family N-acetyltransferase [Bacteroidales bacterium]MCF8398227.1 GNAT family N-acetyltransferase [Bacteroidales bacterium]
MKLFKYGISLNRLKEEDIELIRKWRNSKKINQFMEYREEITPEMQKKWFESVNNNNNFYFIIEYKGEKIGLINTSKADYEDGSSEGGIFLWEEKYYETMVPVWASLLLLETSIYVLQARKSYIKTLKDNERAKKLNIHLGYELMDGQEDVYNQQYELTRERFLEKSPKLIKAATMLAENNEDKRHYIFFDNKEIQSGLADFMESKMDKENIESVKETDEGRYFYVKTPGF